MFYPEKCSIKEFSLNCHPSDMVKFYISEWISDVMWRTVVFILAGKTTTDEELEEMLESGNPSIFTSDVCISGPVMSLSYSGVSAI